MKSTAIRQKNSGGRYREMLFYKRSVSMIHWGVVISFFAIKATIRPLVLESNAPELIQIFVLSYPNLCEAIIGSFLLVSMLTYINEKHLSQRYQIGEKAIILLSLLLAAVYVITQELKIHNLGGRNVYDPYDVLFSVIGLIISFVCLAFIKHSRIQNKANAD